jgi:hypothetical protein
LEKRVTGASTGRLVRPGHVASKGLMGRLDRRGRSGGEDHPGRLVAMVQLVRRVLVVRRVQEGVMGWSVRRALEVRLESVGWSVRRALEVRLESVGWSVRRGLAARPAREARMEWWVQRASRESVGYRGHPALPATMVKMAQSDYADLRAIPAHVAIPATLGRMAQRALAGRPVQLGRTVRPVPSGDEDCRVQLGVMVRPGHVAYPASVDWMAHRDQPDQPDRKVNMVGRKATPVVPGSVV